MSVRDEHSSSGKGSDHGAIRSACRIQACLAAILALAAKDPLAAAAIAAQSNASDAQSTDTLQEVVVTAERRQEKLQDVPMTVTALDESELANRGVTNLGELTEFVPSLELTSTNRPGGGGSAIAAYIRGVGTGDYNFPTDPAIGIYVDGVYMARSLGGLMSLPDVQSIQVLNGPQGTLYGRNTLGGAILITTNDPVLSGPAAGSLELHVGSDGRADGIAYYTAPLSEGRAGYKISLSTYNSNGFGEELETGRDLSDEHRLIFRTGLKFDLRDDLTLDIDADYSGQRNHPPVVATIRYFPGSPLVTPYNADVAPGVNAALGLPAGSGIGPAWISPSIFANHSRAPLGDDYDMGGASIHVTYEPSSALELKSILAYRDLAARIDVEADGTPYRYFTDATVDHDSQLSEELTAGGLVLDGRLNYLAGVYLFRELGHSFDYAEIFHGLYEATGTAKLALDNITLQHVDSRSYAVFSQETYAASPKVSLTAGARLTYDRKYYQGSLSAPQLDEVLVPTETSGPHWTSFTPKISLAWKPTGSLTAYASYSQGFKSGGVTQPIAGLAPQGYEPERLDTTEVGLKSLWLSNRLRANIDGYYSDYKNVQLTSVITLPNGAIAKPTQNAGTAAIWGAETEIDVAPTRGLQLDVSADYTHDRFTALAPGVVAALHAAVGERLPEIPDYDVRAGGQFTFGIPTGSMRLRIDSSLKGRQQMTLGDPTSFQNSYALLNASVTYYPNWGHGLELAFRAFNLTNRRYYAYDQSQSSLNEQLVIPGAPLEWYFSGRYAF
jgi:iron complex outermembrane receptor protein